MKTVWITGGSSGIGEACAYRWAAQGVRLILTAPTTEELEPVAARCREKGAPDVCVLPYDLSKPEGIPALVQTAWEAFDGIDITYLNAGISQRTSVEDTTMDMVRTIMEIDYFAPAAIAKGLLPRMVARGGGHIGVTTSIAGSSGSRSAAVTAPPSQPCTASSSPCRRNTTARASGLRSCARAGSGRTSRSAPWTRAGSPTGRWTRVRPAASRSRRPPASS